MTDMSCIWLWSFIWQLTDISVFGEVTICWLQKIVLRLYGKIVIDTRGSQNKVTHINNHLIVISASQSCWQVYFRSLMIPKTLISVNCQMNDQSHIQLMSVIFQHDWEADITIKWLFIWVTLFWLPLVSITIFP
jgi:hypothetical protein